MHLRNARSSVRFLLCQSSTHIRPTPRQGCGIARAWNDIDSRRRNGRARRFSSRFARPMRFVSFATVDAFEP